MTRPTWSSWLLSCLSRKVLFLLPLATCNLFFFFFRPILWHFTGKSLAGFVVFHLHSWGSLLYFSVLLQGILYICRALTSPDHSFGLKLEHRISVREINFTASVRTQAQVNIRWIPATCKWLKTLMWSSVHFCFLFQCQVLTDFVFVLSFSLKI